MQVEFNYKGNGPAEAPAATPASTSTTTDNTASAATPVAADGLSALAAMTADTAKEATTAKTDSTTATAQTAVQSTPDADLWTPVVKELAAFNNAQNNKSNSLWYIFFMGIIGGLVALLTPCVWPIIPMTVSFFLKRAKDDRKKGIRDAIT